MGENAATTKLMNETNPIETEERQARASLESVIERGKAVCERLKTQTAAAARATDETIRESPYYAIGIAFGVGVLVGLLACRSRRD